MTAPPPNASRPSGKAPIPELILAFLIGATGVALIAFAGSSLPGVDPYYHIQFSRLTWQNGFIGDFPWTQVSLFKDHFSDKELLFHWLLIPATWGDPVLGAKVATCILAGTIFCVFHSLLCLLQVRFRILWTLGLLCSGPLFMGRLAMLRPHLVSILLLLLFMRALHQAKVWRSAGIAFVYALSYSATHLILVVAFLFFIAEAIDAGRMKWKPFAFPIAGFLLGMLVNPYFPDNIYIWYVQTFLAPYHGWGFSGVVLEQGAELGAPPARAFLLGMTLVSLSCVLAVAGYLYRSQRPGRLGWTGLVPAAFFFALTMMSIRFTEYSIPFGLLFAASAFTELFAVADLAKWAEKHPQFVRGGLIALMLGLMAAGAQSVLRSQTSAFFSRTPFLAEAADWVGQNLPENEIVFHTEWSDLPQLFFHAPRQRFLVGLDPIFMYEYDARKWLLWTSVSKGIQVYTNSIIKKEFHSRVAMVNTRMRPRLDAQLRRSEEAVQVFRNPEYAIYRLQ